MRNTRKNLNLGMIILLLTVFVAGISCSTGTMEASEEGIEFSTLSFEDAKAEAAKTGKLIFMDSYAVWCGPCKRMSRDVFTNKAIGDYFNKHFVNLKVDMEKGEGVQLSKTYQIRVYPTLYFINGKGEVVKKAEGYHNTAQLMALAKSLETEE